MPLDFNQVRALITINNIAKYQQNCLNDQYQKKKKHWHPVGWELEILGCTLLPAIGRGIHPWIDDISLTHCISF